MSKASIDAIPGLALADPRFRRAVLAVALVLALTCSAVFIPAAGAQDDVGCPNEASRVGPSAALPDCRAYELATPGLNGSAPETWPQVAVPGVRADGTAIAFLGAGSPLEAEGATATAPVILARRGNAGWSTRSLSAPTPLASGTYFGAATSTLGVSEDLDQSVLYTDQPLAGSASPSGANAYLRRADGTFLALTQVGAAGFDPSATLAGASRDFSRLFLETTVKQPVVGIEDPLLNGNTYEYSAGQLRLVTILPEPSGEEAAPAGGVLAEGALPPVSEDGTQVLFKANGYPGLYLRSDGTKSVEVSRSQRSLPDPDPPTEAVPVGVSADGSKVLLTSVAKLTDDPGVGPTDDPGADLYSYDVATEVLTDLTTDAGPTGADVEAVPGASPDASFVYFVARGNLAAGAASGQRNLYVEHDGEIEFVAVDPEPGAHFYVTPDGRHAAFTSKAPQNSYDNAGFAQAYRYTFGEGVECGSCRPGGEPPTAAASLAGRSLSDDGARLFFQSADAILPAAQSAVPNVYEYAGGQPFLLTPGEGAPAVLLGASASGDDVFIASFEELSPQGQGAVFAIYDARVGGVVPVTGETPSCQGEGCRGPGPPAAPEVGAGSAAFEAPSKVAAPEALSVGGAKVRVRVIVPGAGELEVGGRGFAPFRRQTSAAGSVAFTLALRPGADRKRKRFRIFRTEAEVSFRSAVGAISRAGVALTFRGTAKRGGKK
jgi:hypothetical protein